MSKPGKLRRAVARTCFCAVAAVALNARGQSTNVTVAYTYAGDSNLDGKVNALDFNSVATNFSGATQWTSGDFNYDGAVNGLDFNALASNFNSTLTIAAPSLGALVGTYANDLYSTVNVSTHGKSYDVDIEKTYLPHVLQGQIDAARFNINPEALKALVVADRSLLYSRL